MTMTPQQIDRVQAHSDAITIAARKLDLAIAAAQRDGYEARVSVKTKGRAISQIDAQVVWPISGNYVEAMQRHVDQS